LTVRALSGVAISVLPSVPPATMTWPNAATIADLNHHAEIKTNDDLLPPGAKPGTVPTDLEQATGLERLEILGKMQGIDIFDMRPLDASRVGMLLRGACASYECSPDVVANAGIQVPSRIRLSSTQPATSSTSVALDALRTRTTCSGSLYEGFFPAVVRSTK